MGGIANDIFGGIDCSRSINSKRKGDDSEREVAAFLSRWVCEKFARVPSSGGLAKNWGGNRNFVGDVVPVNENSVFPFSIESKFYKEVKFGDLGRRNKIYSFWRQACRDAELAKKFPMLIVRKNGMPKGEFVLYVDRCMDEGLKIAHVSAGFDTETHKNVWGYNTTTLIDKSSYKRFLEVYLENE